MCRRRRPTLCGLFEMMSVIAVCLEEPLIEVPRNAKAKRKQHIFYKSIVHCYVWLDYILKREEN